MTSENTDEIMNRSFNKIITPPVLISIAGGTGSGKSTFTNRLKDLFGDQISVLYYDNYYRTYSDLTLEERKKINFDHPDVFETDYLLDHLRKLKSGHEIECPVYDYTLYTRSSDVVKIKPSKVIILEGILVLADKRIRDMSDIKVFVEADADERILRRAIRDVKERGRDLEGIAKQYLTTVKPMHYRFVEPTKAFADIVINSGMNDVALDIMASKISTLLCEEEEVHKF